MKGMAKGFAKTLRHLMRPAFTGKYPWEPKVLPPRSRTSFELALDENGVPTCRSCGLCERNCPDGAIHIVSEKNADGRGRTLRRFEIDFGICMFCGLCVENCPFGSIVHTGDFELAMTRREETHVVLYGMGGGGGTDAGASGTAENSQAEDNKDGGRES